LPQRDKRTVFAAHILLNACLNHILWNCVAELRADSVDRYPCCRKPIFVCQQTHVLDFQIEFSSRANARAYDRDCAGDDGRYLRAPFVERAKRFDREHD
jgi:hypothetical protein